MRLVSEKPRFLIAGVEEVYHNANACELLPGLLEARDYQRAFIVCSRSINAGTDVVRRLESALGSKWVGTTDRVGEHAPMNSVLAAAESLREVRADVVIAVGGGSVIDLARVASLCLTEDIRDKQALLDAQARTDLEANALEPSTRRNAVLRIISIPTTLATAEWTFGATPKIEETGLKAFYLFNQSGSQSIIYDPEICALTPVSLLLSTGVRGLDHAINTRCSVNAHPMAASMSEQSVRLFVENLGQLKDNPADRAAMNMCHLACAMSGLTTMSAAHGFSHWMTHIVGPYAGIGHSEAACVLMLAQAKYFEGYADESHGALLKALDRNDRSLHSVLEEFLVGLGMPTRFEDLGLSREQVEEMAPLALEHPLLTRYNLREIKTLEDIRTALAFGFRT